MVSFTSIEIMRLIFSAFTAILFIQSGLDKVFNYRGEKSFYQDHFNKTFLKSTVGLLMPTITIMELASGFLSGAGLLYYIFMGTKTLACWGMLLSCGSILMLFFGQRVAKDYAGASTLVGYFIATSLGVFFYVHDFM